MKTKLFIFLILLTISTSIIYSQNNDVVPFDSDKWKIEAEESKIEDYLGRQCLLIKGGSAVLKDSKFLNGIIEFDIAFNEDRGFTGAIWRILDDYNYEEFYLRPHQSGNPDANQYQPVFNGIAAWQLYYGKSYSSPVKYKFNTWQHVKIVVENNMADIYIDNMDSPALQVNELKRKPETGKVGISTSNFSYAHYSNFKYKADEKPGLTNRTPAVEKTPAGTIMKWLVSNTFNENSLNNKFELNKNDADVQKWTELECEKSGITNLARLQGINKNKNTVFAKIILSSDKDQYKKLDFGYSDRVKVYVNGKLIYGGNNNYLSRDYRYLGTIGYFDEVYLSLHKGDNEVLLAVSEDFGGWGVLAKIVDMEGIEIKP